MMAVQILWILFALLSCAAANSKLGIDVCVLHDVTCVTRGGVAQYNSVVAGLGGTRPVMDPLCIPEIDGQYQLEKFTLTNINLEGLRDCEVKSLRLNVNDESYHHYIHCPNLTSTFVYEAVGLPRLCKDRRKRVTLTASNYDILNVGHYGVLVKEEDLQPHFFIQSVETIPELKGQLTFDICDDTCCEDDDDDILHVITDIVMKAFGGSPDNQKKVIEYLLSIILKKAMEILMDGIDAYCKKYLMGEVLPGSRCIDVSE